MSPEPAPGLSWSPSDHIRHFLYEALHEALSAVEWQDRPHEVLDFGSEWFGDPDGGWQTHMRWMFKALLGDRLRFTLGVYPKFDIEHLDLADESFDVVVADQVLEHVERPWLAADEVWRVLRPGGVAVVATPGLYPIHPSPLDCWRIMPDGYRVIFDDHRWETLTRGMWGTAERASFEYAHNTAILAGSPTLTVEEALAQPTFVEGTDGRCPLQVWWVGRKR